MRHRGRFVLLCFDQHPERTDLNGHVGFEGRFCDTLVSDECALTAPVYEAHASVRKFVDDAMHAADGRVGERDVALIRASDEGAARPERVPKHGLLPHIESESSHATKLACRERPFWRFLGVNRSPTRRV